jgi:hypothetical protein
MAESFRHFEIERLVARGGPTPPRPATCRGEPRYAQRATEREYYDPARQSADHSVQTDESITRWVTEQGYELVELNGTAGLDGERFRSGRFFTTPDL